MTAHTPGPWEADGCEVFGPGRKWVAESLRGVGESGPDADALADARLIAAAPDLLTAARELLSWAEEKCAETHPGHPSETFRLNEAMRQAIAKALGSTADPAPPTFDGFLSRVVSDCVEGRS